MATARNQKIYPEITPYYLCTSRCVRRAWLFGEDPLTGRNFDHRKGWIEDRILFLSTVFAIDLVAYAVMSNHYHVVIHLDRARCRTWDTRDVIRRWGQVCRLPTLARAYLEGDEMNKLELAELAKKTESWRERLSSISWFMRFANERLARMANKEDDCSGRFWEGRFDSQALLDVEAVLTGMAYVDLNPLRASAASTPESSAYTSVRRRLICSQHGLMPMADEIGLNCDTAVLPIEWASYLQLIDWSGRVLASGKRGRIKDNAPPILERLGGYRVWMQQIQRRPRRQIFFGSATRLREICAAVGRRYLKGVSSFAAPPALV